MEISVKYTEKKENTESIERGKSLSKTAPQQEGCGFVCHARYT